MILLVILVGAFLAGLIILFIDYDTHIEMNKKEHLPYDFVIFDRFIEEFNKYKDNVDLEYNKLYNSWFLERPKRIVYIHAGIIIFNNKCMILYPISFLRFKLWEYKNKRFNILNDDRRQKGLWEN